MDRLLIAVLIVASTGCSSFDTTQATSTFPVPDLVTTSHTTGSGDIESSIAVVTPAAYPMTASRAVADKGGVWLVAAPVTVVYDVAVGTAVSAGRAVGALVENTIEHPVRNPAICLAAVAAGLYATETNPFDDSGSTPKREPTTFTANGQQLDATAGGFDECRFLEERHESGSGKTEIECKRHED